MKTGRKISGGKYHKPRKKKFYEKKSPENQVSLGETKRKTLRTIGGNSKTRLLKTDTVNLTLANKKAKSVKIKNVLETPQNLFLARQNRILKGAIIETSEGKARITNRPSKEGHVNAVLVE